MRPNRLKNRLTLTQSKRLIRMRFKKKLKSYSPRWKPKRLLILLLLLSRLPLMPRSRKTDSLLRPRLLRMLKWKKRELLLRKLKLMPN